MKRNNNGAALRAAGFLAALLGGGALLPASAAAAPKTLIYCAEAAPGGFDPALYMDGATYAASSKTVYSRLVDFARGSADIVPALAESWDISPDGKTYIFHLRKGVKFQTTPYFKPSRAFSADDVVFSFARQMDKNSPWNAYTGGESYQIYGDMNMPQIIKSVDKVDDNTVRFTLYRAQAPFLADMAMDFTSIMSKEYADKLQAAGKMEDLNLKPVGTGPFILADYQLNAVARFRANPDYWGKKQQLDNLIFAIVPDNAVRAQKMRAGECQVMSYPSPTDMPMLEADKNITIARGIEMNVSYLAYNTTVKPFDDVRVRRALNMAVNKKALVDIVFRGFGAVAQGPLPPSLWGYNSSLPADEYNPEQAKKLLAEAGVKNLAVSLWALPVSRPYMPNGRRAAELIQSDWKAIGVKTDITSMEWGEYLKAAADKKRKSAVMVGWISDNGDPDNFLAALNSCATVGTGNYAMWCNKDYDALVEKAAVLSDKAARAKLYQQAQVIFMRAAPWLPLAYGQSLTPVSNRVKNFHADISSIRFDDVDIAPK